MVLIPPDAAIRMRMQTEANLLQPVQPAHEIPSDLPELRPGQTFNARIQETLPDNTYRALVTGKQLTLQLPEGAKPGDQMELVVIDRSARVVIARQVEAGNTASAASETAPYAYAKFSPAARLIGQLLPVAGEAPPPAQLNRGQPLLTVSPQTQSAAAMLAPALGKAVAQSGVFYEAHQAQWVSGKLPLDQLLQEPQGQKSAAVTQLHETAVSATVRQIPDDLRPLVQQQLEAAATNRMVWHGEVWPRQSLDWEIEWDGERAAAGDSDAEARWRTALSLTTPRLGRVDAKLQLSARGVSIALATSLGTSVADLRAASAELARTLAAAGVPLLGFQVNLGNEHPAGQG